MDYKIRVPSVEEFEQIRSKIREQVIEHLTEVGLDADVSEWERDDEQDDIFLVINSKKIFYDDVLELYAKNSR